MRRIMALVLASSTATACTTVREAPGKLASNLSDRLTPVDARLWRPGVTTLAQVSDMLGPPADDNFLPDGARLIRWRGNVGVRSSQRLAYGFVFTRSGLLVRRATVGEMHAPGL